MSPGQLFILLTLVLAAAGCAAKFDSRKPPEGEDQIAAALVAGDDSQIRQITDQVLAGTRPLNRGMLTDERTVAPGVILRATIENKQWQLGAERVSDFGLCLLELRNRTSSDEILNTIAPVLRTQCTIATTSNAHGCEVCNSQAIPVSDDVRSALVTYWRSRQ
jgi:hypothetical protein